jgi:hypothetical protein
MMTILRFTHMYTDKLLFFLAFPALHHLIRRVQQPPLAPREYADTHTPTQLIRRGLPYPKVERQGVVSVETLW